MNHNQNKPYQVLTNSATRPRRVVHQYEDVDNDNGTIIMMWMHETNHYVFYTVGNYSEPYNGKKLPPRHDYDLVAGMHRCCTSLS